MRGEIGKLNGLSENILTGRIGKPSMVADKWMQRQFFAQMRNNMNSYQRKLVVISLRVLTVLLHWSFTDWEGDYYFKSDSSSAIIGFDDVLGINALSAETRTRDIFLGLVTPVILFSVSLWFSPRYFDRIWEFISKRR